MSHRICLIEGDGIGHEVVPAAGHVLEALGPDLVFTQAEAGFACFQRQGTPLPQETIARVEEADATLFGAVSSPVVRTPGYRSAIVSLRHHFDLYANLRPVISPPLPSLRQGIDLIIVRENTEGLYVGQEEETEIGAVAQRVITRRGSERIARFAFQLARSKGRGKVTIVHKANVLPLTCGLFRSTALKVAREYSEIEVEDMIVDTMAMHLVKDPENFDVIVTTNMFGDILSDEASFWGGGLGMVASGNIGDEKAIFEPVHGSAPDIAGMGIANPLATFGAAAMLLEYLEERESAARLKGAVSHTLQKRILTPDLGGQATTGEVTQAVIQELVRG